MEDKIVIVIHFDLWLLWCDVWSFNRSFGLGRSFHCLWFELRNDPFVSAFGNLCLEGFSSIFENIIDVVRKRVCGLWQHVVEAFESRILFAEILVVVLQQIQCLEEPPFGLISVKKKWIRIISDDFLDIRTGWIVE